jgi:golgi phosphoprotein 3
MSSGLQRRRVAGGATGESSTPPTLSRPELTSSNHNSFSGRASPAVAAAAAAGLISQNSEVINSIDQLPSDHTIAFDPRDLEEGEERQKFPKLTMMEEVLLLGLKDKQVCSYLGRSIDIFF